MELDVLTTDNINILLEDFKFKAFGKKYTIPAGFKFDGGSIPRLFWSISHPLYYPYITAFLIHDRFYSNGLISRKKADKLFFEMVYKKNKIKGVIFYVAVRLFGFFAYNK